MTKNLLLPIFVFWLLAIPRLSFSQCLYTSMPGGGAWSAPATWQQVDPFNCPAIPDSTSIITINSAVILDQNASLTSSGTLIIGAGGSLTEDGTPRTLRFGENSGSTIGRLMVDSGGTLVVSEVRFLKSEAVIDGTLTSRCTFSLENQATITVNGRINVLGNLHLTTGNANMNGVGQVLIAGCAVGSNGGLNGLISPPLSVCVLQRATTCATGTCNPNANDIINTNAACNPTVLPVVLTDFVVRYDEPRGHVLALWQTASEDHNAYFVLERSADGRRFSEVTSVSGAGTSHSVHEYESTDRTPLTGQSYYRLQQRDHDGRVTYSASIPLKRGNQAVLEVFPASENGQFTVTLPTLAHHELTVFSTLGRTVLTHVLTETDRTTGRASIDLGAQPAGCYLVLVATSEGVRVQRVVVP